MQIESLHIKNFRSISDVQITFEQLTALIGGNNAGKSTILKAIDYFFEAAPVITPNDFCSYNDDENIEITITFKNFTADEIEEFGDAIIDERMLMTRYFFKNDIEPKIYSVQRRGYKGFQNFRNESAKGKQLTEYRKIAKGIIDLPTATTAEQAEAAINEWEEKHPEKLTLQKHRGFFGTPNIASSKLKKRTGIHFIPAVRDAVEDATNPKNSEIIELLSEISKQTIENKQEMKDFLEKTRIEFDRLSDPKKIPELANISIQLTEELKKIYTDASLNAHWQGNEDFKFQYPKPSLTIEHAGTPTALSHVGHGLQRAVLFSVVQYLAAAKSTIEQQDEDFVEAASDIILLIEEPEIYQHPSKQLVIYKALNDISQGFNKTTGIRVQIIYATHSEKLISMSNFQISRIIRRGESDGKKNHSVAGLKVSECSNILAKLTNKQPMSEDAFCSKLHIFTREVCEGFFAQKIILVEGATDKATLEAAYRIKDRDIHIEAISIIDMKSKSNLDKPYLIFSKLGIPTFMIFDNDKALPPSAHSENKNNHIVRNKHLQKILGIENVVDWPSGCQENFCSFEHNLESYLKSQLGKEFDALFNKVATNYDLQRKDILKNPTAMASVFTLANDHGFNFPLFDEIIQKVDNLYC